MNISKPEVHEMAPVIFKNGLIFLDNRVPGAMKGITIETSDSLGAVVKDVDLHPASIYFAEKKGENDWGTPQLFASELTTRYFDGPGSFANDFRLFCFSRMYLDEKGRPLNGNTGIFFADFKEDSGKWVNVREFEYNDPEVSFYAPYITPDGRELYFTAEMADSRGGHDIYISRYARGRWSEPENLGDNINTASHERHPFKHRIGRLYFSRKPTDGSDDADLYYSNLVSGSWAPAVPMRSPDYNSQGDDLAIFIDDHFLSGYISRRRPGQTFDIFSFYTDYPALTDPARIESTSMRYRLKENSLDTIDHEVFDYEWVINDTLTIPGIEVLYEFPGPGDYHISFNVYNKLTDTAMLGVAKLFLPIRLVEQPNFTFAAQDQPGSINPDTVATGKLLTFDASSTYLPGFEDKREYFWDFGDGGKAKGKQVTHQFTYEGEFKIILGVRAATGDEDEPSEPISRYRKLVVKAAD